MTKALPNKTLLTTAAAAAVAAPGAFGELLTSEVYQEIFNPGSSVFIDLDTNRFSTTVGVLTDVDFEVRGKSGPDAHGKANFDAQFPTVGFFVEETDTAFSVKRFAAGDALIGNIQYAISVSTENSAGEGSWGDFTGIAYAGFERDGNLGWVELDYNPGTGGTGSIKLTRFAYANAGEQIRAGQTVIPEPATTAGLMALVAGSAALYARRRKSAT